MIFIVFIIQACRVKEVGSFNRMLNLVTSQRDQSSSHWAFGEVIFYGNSLEYRIKCSIIENQCEDACRPKPGPVAYNQSAIMFQTEEMIIHNETNVWKFILLWAHQILCCMFFTCYLTCYLWQCENRYCYYARIELTIHGLIVIWDRQVCKWMSQELPQELFFFFDCF